MPGRSEGDSGAGGMRLASLLARGDGWIREDRDSSTAWALLRRAHSAQNDNLSGVIVYS